MSRRPNIVTPRRSAVIARSIAFVVAAAASGCTTGGIVDDDFGSVEVPGAGTGTSAGNAGGGVKGFAGAGGRSGGVSGGATGAGCSGGASGRAGEAGAVGAGGRAGTGGSSDTGGRASFGGAPATGGVATTGGHGGSTSGGRSAGGRAGETSAGGKAGATNVAGTGGGSAGSAGAVDACATMAVPSGGTSHCSSNQSGNVGSLQWTVWSSGGGGCLVTYGSATAFSASWNNSGDFLARVGLALGSSKTYDQFGTVSADFAEKKSGNGGGYSSIGVYGWSVSPLVEFYVVEDSYQRLGGSGTKKGTFTIDGEGTYDVYQHQQTNQPSIQGTTTFQQYLSVRQSARTCGHISLTKHFDAWKSFGMTLGKLEEAKVLVEAGGGTGSIDFPTANVTAQ